MGTNKVLLMKGIRYMFGALPLFFLGPVIIHTSFKNQGKTLLFYPVIAFGILACIGAIFLVFLGLKTIMKSLFD
jgi:putative Mn2+ efflux pump MntP